MSAVRFFHPQLKYVENKKISFNISFTKKDTYWSCLICTWQRDRHSIYAMYLCETEYSSEKRRLFALQFNGDFKCKEWFSSAADSFLLKRELKRPQNVHSVLDTSLFIRDLALCMSFVHFTRKHKLREKRKRKPIHYTQLRLPFQKSFKHLIFIYWSTWKLSPHCHNIR